MCFCGWREGWLLPACGCRWLCDLLVILWFWGCSMLLIDLIAAIWNCVVGEWLLCGRVLWCGSGLSLYIMTAVQQYTCILFVNLLLLTMNGCICIPFARTRITCIQMRCTVSFPFKTWIVNLASCLLYYHSRALLQSTVSQNNPWRFLTDSF